ncbi:MAG: cytochrome d ubiquinol oxidase subunit II, partial [Alphaproteobacteria bacterium]|nr:cytochrome d ubiquinol oxidase subunit II [Alphaproteobacteria bacterium]
MEFLDYTVLRVIWWALLGVLLIGFAVTDGFDMGVASLLPFVAKTETEKRVAINTIGPVWEGNQVWLILGGGAIFAAWPALYAVSFSGFYFAMFIALVALILRPVAFKFRSKRECTKWRSMWDLALFIGGLVPALIFGVAVGNVLLGVPFYFDDTLRPFYDGNLFGLLNPFALVTGVLSVLMLSTHGALWLSLKASGQVQARANTIAMWSIPLVGVVFVLLGVVVHLWLPGFVITSDVVTDGPSNPLLKEVAVVTGGWGSNFDTYPLFWIAPLVGLAGLVVAWFALLMRIEWVAFVGSKLSIGGIITTVGLSMFPFILPSSKDPSQSLTVWDSSSSELTLFIMLIATLIFMPLIL